MCTLRTRLSTENTRLMIIIGATFRRSIFGTKPRFNKTLKASAIITLLSLFGACSATSSKPDITLPTNSSAYNRESLAGDMTSAAHQYMERKFACEDWSLVDVKKSVAFGQLVFTNDGRLFKGEIAETWSVNSCGEAMTLSLRAEPTPEGSSIIRIRPIAE